ncbi:hypothetical protein P368_12515 [Comamonas thiooxydans]|nr:hypothetical protein P365_16665 [Comamonas thiooxydans]KGH11938.1 hypothetical protein P368_12515 [Comamonas thiooxydans]
MALGDFGHRRFLIAGANFTTPRFADSAERLLYEEI